MRGPIIVAEDGVLAAVYDSLVDAESHLEAYDVSRYVAYDSDGVVLHLAPLPNDSVRITEELLTPERRPNELRGLLESALLSRGERPETGASLDDLISMARQHFRRAPKIGLRQGFVAPVLALWKRLIGR